MAISNTDICNMALGRIGANRIDNFLTDTSTPAVQCRLHFEQTRDMLVESYPWRFASARVELVEHDDSPDFEYDNQFILPDGFLAQRSIYENRFSAENLNSYALEGQLLLTNDTTVELRYIKQVTDPTEFDPLFIEFLVLTLGLKLLTPLSGAAPKIRKELKDELKDIETAVKARSGQEMNTIGKYELETWNDARYE